VTFKPHLALSCPGIPWQDCLSRVSWRAPLSCPGAPWGAPSSVLAYFESFPFFPGSLWQAALFNAGTRSPQTREPQLNSFGKTLCSGRSLGAGC